MGGSEYVLQMTGIVKSFPGVRALDKTSLSVKYGQVHGLIGENGAGKSTLMKILSGIYTKDSGSILYKGEPVDFKTPFDALTSGVSMIHQEISLIPTTDVSENIWLGREKKFMTAGIIVSRKKRYRATEELLETLGLSLNPKAIINTLSLANMQLVELARAVSYNSDIVIMDEPTSSLTDVEVELLYRTVRKLCEQGKSIIYISHKLEEVLEICDEVTVFRDGKFVASHLVSEITKHQLIEEMAGRTIENLFPKLPAKIEDVVLELKGLSSGKAFSNISFSVRKGEILGLCGLVGAGRTEIMRAVFGLDKYDSGEIYLDGKVVKIRTPRDAISNGIGMVTEDRLRTGIIPTLQVRYNITLSYLRSISPMGIIRKKQENKDANSKTEALSIRTPTTRQLISLLSGGNQQKSILARWLLTNPKVLILDEPTRGIDVGSKAEIHRIISEFTQQGLAVILISSEMPEILGMSDRILVVCEGRLVAEVSREEATQELLLQHAFSHAHCNINGEV